MRLLCEYFESMFTKLFKIIIQDCAGYSIIHNRLVQSQFKTENEQ